MTTTTPPSTLKPIRSAAILIIGDEILNGKILDTNSYHFARFCFNNLAIPLKRTIVCGDDELDIKNSLDVLLKQDKVDFVVTSGGLGSTHDDITYQVLASYFNLDYKLDEEVVKKMHSLRDGYLSTLSKDQLGAFYRMATLPVASKDSPISTKNLFFDEKLWFPILEIDQSVYVLPGVPQLFTQLLNDMEPFLKRRVAPTNLSRRYVVTKTGETQLAPYLTRLQQDCIAKHGEGVVKLGSYPHMDSKVNTISIIGKDLENPSVLNGIVGDLIENVGGDAKEISQEEEDKLR
ncbi:uncharacterized protein LODBEIA_P40810 [Lodderomyces beijingensis]|uniref:MoaB/Mog domain-containing protein n=1 Tax=Lodderomyces beijingensis TaxID=1775926 RepID=A0ABP0ZUA0_9ASCO